MNLTQLIDIKEKLAIGAPLTRKESDFVLDCVNAAIDQNTTVTAAIDTPNYLGRIDHIWAFLSLDEGGEGVCAAPLGHGMLTVPMIAADAKRLDSLKPIARKLANLFRKPVRLAKFTAREDVEIYQPIETGG
jgi:hypothetical protein